MAYRATRAALLHQGTRHPCARRQCTSMHQSVHVCLLTPQIRAHTRLPRVWATRTTRCGHLCKVIPALRGTRNTGLFHIRRTRQQWRGARFEVRNAFIHAAHHTRAKVSVKSSPLSGDLSAACWSSSPIRGATDSACLAYADIRQHRFRKRLFARRTQRIVEQAARPQAARVVPQQTHASRTGGSTTDARARDSRYEMLALMLHITHAQNSPNPAGACA